MTRRVHRHRSALLLVAVALMGVLIAPTGSAQAASADYIVILRPGVSLQAHLKAQRIAPNRLYSFGATGYEAVLNETQYQRELASSDVTIITPNSVTDAIEPTSRPACPPSTGCPPFPQTVSNGVKRVGGLLSPTAAIDGVDTRVDADVAIIDTGVDSSHPDLNVAGGADCSGNNGWEDKYGHGSMVAGFVGALDNSIGKVGVAPGARIWAIQVENNAGAITEGALVCAVDWVTAHASTIEVANMSLSGPFKPHQETGNCGIAAKKADGDPLHAAICASVAAGVTYVVGAGNDSHDASLNTPAAYTEVITVSAMSDSDGQPGGLGPMPFCLTDKTPMPDDTFATFSNFGSVVDIAAPGVCLVSTYYGDWYGFGSGTSFASPLVAGAAALYISTHPGATPTQVRSALISLAEPGPIPGDPDAYPEGIVNVSTL